MEKLHELSFRYRSICTSKFELRRKRQYILSFLISSPPFAPRTIIMADSAATVDVAVPVTGSSPAAKKSKSASAASKKPRAPKAHPPTAEMVNSAITSLKERGGSSLQAIKKYLTSTYKIDAEKLAPFIKKYLRTAVTGGQLIQTKGKGASGSFKLPATKTTAAKKPKSAEKKPKAKKVVATVAAKKKATAATKKVAGAKKAVEKKKVATTTAKAAKKSASVKAAKSPKQKPTKATKTVAKKPKTPKPKKVTATKKAATATKKVAAPKKK